MMERDSRGFIPPLCLETGSYCDIFENMHEGVSIYKIIRNRGGNIVDLQVMYFNSKSVLNEITNLEEAVGKSLNEIYAEDSVYYIKIANEVVSNKKRKNFERFFKPLNKYLFITTFSPDGELFIMLTRDITEEKISESALKASENKYRTIFENTGIAFIIIEEDMTISLMNEETEKIIGYSREEVENKKKWTEFVVNEEELMNMKKYHKMRRINADSVPERYEFQAIDKNGKIKDILANVSMIPGTKRSIASFLDITGRKKNENKLKEREEELRTIIEHSPDAITRFDKNLRHTFINPAGTKMTGLKEEDYIGKTHAELGISKELAKEVDNLLKGVFKTGKTKTFEFEINTPEGVKYYYSYNIPEFDEKGRVKSVLAIAHDITDRKKAEEDLMKSEKKFRTTIEESYDGIMLIDEKKAIIEWNRAMEEITGLKREDMLGSFLWDFVYRVSVEERKTPEAYKRIKSILIKNLRNSGEIHHDYRLARQIQRPNGERRFIESTIYPIKTEKGIMYGSITRDITENKRLEEELRNARINLELQVQKRTKELEKTYRSLKESEQKFRELFNKADDMITLVELKENGLPGKFVEVNDITSQRLGYSKNELLNMTPLDIIAPERLEDVPKNARELKKKKKARFEIVHLTKDGERIPVENNNHLFELGGKTFILAISRDISERKKAELALKESEELLKTTIESSPDSITVTDLDLNIILCNQATVDMYGVSSKDDIIGLNAFELVDPKDRGKLVEVVQKSLLNMEIVHLEINLFTKDKKESFPAEISGNIIKDAHGKPISFVAITKDITERKKAEKELKDTIEELTRSNNELQQFAYITSHDLQEPLRAISSYAGLLKRRYGGQLDQDADDFIEFMIDGSRRMKEMIQALLEYSRVGTKGGDFKVFNVEKSLEIALNNLSVSIDENKAVINHDPLPDIFADPNQITRVFQNLIGNAIKFRKEDEPPEIYISAQKSEDEWVFSVSDNSIGMEQEYTDKIFEIFRRLHPIGEYRGAGIGLAIVKRIIDRHGGHIWVESQLGKGSTFYFTIPLKIK
ncbi:MAG: PAS domain S-box protein [Methanobacterium sp.]|nr:PAS domain S-box protein [Methanobacterium sp.]